MNMDGDKILAWLDEIYECGKQPDGGYSRLAFSPEDKKGRETFMNYFRGLGIIPQVDKAGNIIARLEGKNPDLPTILVGSHLDTVPNGGKYDGALGCVAGLGVCEALVEAGKQLEHPLEVVVFADEEGARFGSGLLGSSAFCGEKLDFSDDDVDVFGRTRKDVFDQFGLSTGELEEAARSSETVHCFLELHIEQGVSLYKNKIPVGVVSSIAGVSRYEITVDGEANHAGSTLMEDRKDALVASAGFMAQVPGIVHQWGNQYTVATVGTVQVQPGSVNVVPGSCTFALEIRDQDRLVMEDIANRLTVKLAELCSQQGCTHRMRQISYHEPAPMADWVQDAIKGVCDKRQYNYTVMPSGAFHDSLVTSPVFPTGMIFIPSVDGISHSLKEFSTPEDIRRGCDILLETILAVDLIVN